MKAETVLGLVYIGMVVGGIGSGAAITAMILTDNKVSLLVGIIVCIPLLVGLGLIIGLLKESRKIEKKLKEMDK